MEYYGLVEVLQTYCEERGYHYIYGSSDFANALLEGSRYKPNDIILIADFTCIPTVVGGKIQEIRYTGILSVGQKCEEHTESSLDETPLQKYTRRLKDLSNLLTLIIANISCDNELEAINISLKYDLNQFDLNADFVACSITFVQ